MMPTPLTSQAQIPAAYAYVTMTDRFLSGWGMAEGCNARYVVPCDSWEEAETVARNAESRGDQKHVNIRTSKPRVTDGNYWQLMTRETSAVWFEPGAFDHFKEEAR